MTVSAPPLRAWSALARLWMEDAAGIAAAAALAAAFPRMHAVWLEPFALAAVLFTWRRTQIARTALVAFLEGTLFFTIAFAWFGDSLGTVVGRISPLLALGAGLFSSWTWAFGGAVGALATRVLRPPVVALALALDFTLCELVRTLGPLGNPFGTLSEPLVASPLAPLAAYGGATLVTFALTLVCASAATVRDRDARRAGAVACIVVAAATVAAWLAWPARAVAPPTIPVALVQADIPQSMKWRRATLATSVERYVAMTDAIRTHPRIVVWPETVITVYLRGETDLRSRFAELAQSDQTTIVAGTDDFEDGMAYNALWYFTPDGEEHVYHKQRLVPFAEYLPARQLLGALPIARLVSTFTGGTGSGIVRAGDIATVPLICYESAFSALVQSRVAEGGDLLIIATDDGWFGRTGGPYQHAELASMRAIETGRWAVRAAATGLSGIIAPDGRYTQRLDLGVRGTIAGNVGTPQPTLFSRIGTLPFAAAYVAALASLFVFARKRSAAER